MTQQDIKAITDIITSTQTQLSEQLSDFKIDIDARLDRFEGRLDRVEGRMDRLEDQVREGFDRANTTLDGIAGRLDIDDTERVALSAQVTRHEDWIMEAAPVTSVKYVPGA